MKDLEVPARTVALGVQSLQAAPWPADGSVALLTRRPSTGERPLDAALVATALAGLAGTPFRMVITPALGPAEQQPFLDAGFEVREALQLLARRLDALPAPVPLERRLRRLGHRDWSTLVEVDAQAFAARPFWRFDQRAIADARSATPSSRLRTTEGVRGYAVSGRSGTRGYLQRLAVDPSVQGQGWGMALALDGLRWMKRRGATEALVNTQTSNARALALYERLGFVVSPEPLVVLSHPLGVDA